MRTLKLIIGIALLFVLFHYGILDFGHVSKATAKLPLLGLAIAALIMTIIVQSLRWFILLRVVVEGLSFAKVLQIVWISGFFNAFFPGAFGGDLVRAAYTYRENEERKAMALLSILMDRLTGICGLMLIGLGMNFLFPLGEQGFSRAASLGIFFIFFSAVIFLLFFGHRISSFISQRFSSRLGRLAAPIEEVSQALEIYMKQWRPVVLCLGLSVVLYSFAIIGLLMTATILNIGNLSLPQYAVAGIWSILANNLPVTPGGLGVGEGAFAEVAHYLEPVKSGAPYATVFLVYRAVIILATVPGVVLYFFYSKGRKLSEMA